MSGGRAKFFGKGLPFGKVRATGGTLTQNLGLPGQWFQLESGLAHNWHRHYDPTTGRYTTADPLGFVDGPGVYAYAGNNPHRMVDPTGQCPWCIAVGAGAVIGALIDIGIQKYEGKECIDWTRVGAAALAGGIGARIGLGSSIKIPGTEFSHFIPNRYFRPNSPSYKPWLPNLGKNPLNGNYVPPTRHAAHDGFRHLGNGADKIPQGLRQIDRAPGWLGGAIGGAGSVSGGYE
jgi:RHS repeat-associated protein